MLHLLLDMIDAVEHGLNMLRIGSDYSGYLKLISRNPVTNVIFEHFEV